VTHVDGARTDAPGTASLLRDGAFLRVWLTGGAAGVLRWLELLAISVYVLQTTGSPFLVALMMFLRMAPMMFLRMAPMFLFGIPAGALADRYDRKRLLLIGLVALAGAAALLTLLAVQGRIALWHIAVGTFLNGMFWASEFPVRRIMLGEIAGMARLSRAMALESATSNATRMIGPALGGVLIEATGLYGVYALGALLYLACAALVLPVAYRSAGAAAGSSLLAMLRDGWRFARSERLIVGTLAVTLIVNLWGFAYITMVPVIGERMLALSPALIGALMSTEGLGAVIGALLVARYDRPRQYTRIYTASSAAFLLGVLAFALSTWAPLSVALMLFCGIGIAGFAVMQTTIVFLAAPAAVRSRVMGLLTVAIGGGPIGMLYVGVLADWLGAANAVACLAIQGLILLALAAWCWPELRRPVALTGFSR
jgi:MFS family permease